MPRTTFSSLFDKAAIGAFVIIGGVVGNTLFEINSRTAKIERNIAVYDNDIAEIKFNGRARGEAILSLVQRVSALEVMCRK